MNVQQQRNLIRVALFLARGKSPVKFNMKRYVGKVVSSGLAVGRVILDHRTDNDLSKYNEVINECNTCCCFAGHGPMVLGIDECDYNWTSYQLNHFGVCDTGHRTDYRLWDFLFWAGWPDDEVQAAYRAVLVLEDPEYIFQQWDGCTYNRFPKVDKGDVIKRLRKLQRSKLKDIDFSPRESYGCGDEKF